ncbi:MAG TPA: hypothetical protein VLF93_02695 [Candidatus Saccharimonadales bacterium]|nr:hypothetical protein [Candidatus Saccharimonadales bacterium]
MSTTHKSNDIVSTMAEWFDKFPQLPKNGRDTLAKIAPWIALIFGILGVLVGISGLGVLTFLAPLSFLGGASEAANYGSGIIVTLIYLVGSVLLLASYPGLKARKYSGWNLLFWSEVVHLVGGLIALSFVSTIIWALIAFYLLFQIRSYFK